MADLDEYLNLVPSENRGQPNFIATLSAVLQPLVDWQNTVLTFPALYDLDVAAGVQEDATGEWIGATRYVTEALTGVFFSWNTAALGWNQGSWAPTNSPTQLIALPDDAYRTLLRGKIAANNWDGTIPGAYAVFAAAFAGTPYGILIQDRPGMHMAYALTGPVPDALTFALFTSGLLTPKPAGVKVDEYYTPVVPDVPYFGWGVENAGISGWNVGYWGVQTPGA